MSLHHAPLFALQRINVCVAVTPPCHFTDCFGGWVEDDNALVGIIVDHSAFLDELTEWGVVKIKYIKSVQSSNGIAVWQLLDGKWVDAVEHFRYADTAGTTEHHDASICGKEDGAVKLCDAVRIDADITGDWWWYLPERAILCHFERPHSFVGECVEWELSVLSLRHGFDRSANALDFSCADGVDAFDGEIEWVVDFGGVDFVGEGNGFII